MNVVGAGPIVTTPEPLMSVYIELPAGSTTFSVQVFDGNSAGQFDVTPAPTVDRTYFTLYADPNETCGAAGGLGVPIAQKLDTDAAFATDAAYGTLFTGTVDPAAKAANGSYHYRFEAAIGDPLNPNPGASAFNGFKVRVTQAAGQTGARIVSVCAPFQFIAADAVPNFPNATPPCCSSPNTFLTTADTHYDGIFDFYVDIGASNAGGTVYFHDKDADDTSSPDPSCAAGQNAEIHYDVFNPDGTLAHRQDVVSGDCSACTNLCSSESIGVQTKPLSGSWRWRWTDLLTENQVAVTQPTPVMSFPMRMQPAPFRALPVTSARPATGWLALGDLTPYLPIVIGSIQPKKGQSLLIQTNGEARSILVPGPGQSGAASQGDPGSIAVRDLQTELFVTKLNVFYATSIGEPLASARVYGTDFLVSDVVSSADAALASMPNPKKLSAAEIARLDALRVMLRAINAGEISYFTALPAPPLAAARSARAAAPSQSLPGAISF